MTSQGASALRVGIVLQNAPAELTLRFAGSATCLYVASIYDALERDDMVLATYRAALSLVPEASEIPSGASGCGTSQRWTRNSFPGIHSNVVRPGSPPGGMFSNLASMPMWQSVLRTPLSPSSRKATAAWS